MLIDSDAAALIKEFGPAAYTEARRWVIAELNHKVIDADRPPGHGDALSRGSVMGGIGRPAVTVGEMQTHGVEVTPQEIYAFTSEEAHPVISSATVRFLASIQAFLFMQDRRINSLRGYCLFSI